MFAKPMNSKGFLGPIGDDLPSIIPLLTALIIFFSTFTLTYNVFGDRNDDFAADLTALNIGRTMRANSFISGTDPATNENQFEELCGSITATNINYYVTITSDFALGNPPDNIFAVTPYEDVVDGYVYECYHYKSGTDFSEQGTADRPVLVRIYPIVLEQEHIAYPMHIAVVVWK